MRQVREEVRGRRKEKRQERREEGAGGEEREVRRE